MVDLEWRLIYVASPGNEALDQELDDCLVGPVPVGVNAFEFEGSAPNPSKIPPEDVMGVAALILTGSYKEQEFVRVGYYQNTEYDNEEMKEALPEPIRFDRLVRDINTKPRVTRFQIKWCAAFACRSVVPLVVLGHQWGRMLWGDANCACQGCGTPTSELGGGRRCCKLCGCAFCR